MGVADSVAAFEQGGMFAMRMDTLPRLRTRSLDHGRSMVSTSPSLSSLGVQHLANEQIFN